MIIIKYINILNMCETLYSDEFMINRLCDTIEGNKSEKMVIDEPVISRKNKRTIIENFGTICFKINRDIDIVKDYIQNKLAKKQEDITLSSAQALIITGSYNNIDLKRHIENYIVTYVICSECRGGDTVLEKENRLLWLKCNKCNCKKAIQTK